MTSDAVKLQHHKDLKVWQASRAQVKAIYEMTAAFPKDELYGLTSQLRRCVISIPSNIAEGAARPSRKEYQRFIGIALGSSAELETQLYLSMDIGYIDMQTMNMHVEKLEFIRRMLINLYRALGEEVSEPRHTSHVTGH